MIYVLTGLAYDENNRIEEREEYIYDESFDYTDVYESFVKLQCKNAQELFKNIPKDVFQLLIQVEECIETKDGIECINVKNEEWVKNPYYIRKDENTMKNYCEQLEEKIEQEMKEFKDNVLSLSSIEIYNESYKIVFFENYYELFDSKCEFAEYFKIDIILWLLTFDNPLDFLYNEWLSCDNPTSYDFDDMIEFIKQCYINERGE